LQVLPRRNEITGRGICGLNVRIQLPNQILDRRLQNLLVRFAMAIRQSLARHHLGKARRQAMVVIKSGIVIARGPQIDHAFQWSRHVRQRTPP